MEPLLRIPRPLRNQRGGVKLRSGYFLIQYYTTVMKDGVPVRRRVSEKLVKKDDRHYSASCKAVRDLQAEFMRRVNANNGAVVTQDVSVVKFWEDTYLPWLTESGKRASTIRGYEYIWKLYLKDHFGQTRLKDYRTHHGFQFLNGLAKTLSRASVAHVRSLASAIFTHAVNLGLLEANPWREVRAMVKGRVPAPKGWYTVEEILGVLDALAGFPAYQLMFALAFYAGLRPEEIAGLRWEDVETDWLHVKRTVVRGALGDCKTERAKAPVPLIEPLRSMLAAWWQSSEKPTAGWVLPSRRGGPHASLSNVAYQYVRPILLKKGLAWKSLYCGRRGVATELTEITGSNVAAQQILRHGNLGTTNIYIQQMPRAGVAGLALIEQKHLELASKNGDK